MVSRHVQDFRVGTIQEAALRVISRKGVAGTTVQEVAKEAGIAKGTVYLYFKSREDLVARTGRFAVDELRARLDPILRDDTLRFDVRLRRLVETKIAFFHEHREFFRLYSAICQAETGPGRCKQKQYDDYLGVLSSVLARAMRKGEVHKADPERVALFLAEAVHAVVIRRLSETKSPPPAAEAEWIADVLLRGLWVKGGAK